MEAFGPVALRIEDNVAWVTIDNPPVNATSTAVRAGLIDAIGSLGDARVAILTCAGRTFVAGGDMTEFDEPAVPPHLPDVVRAIEDSPVPFVAAMHGTVLGGGLELALGCAWRIAQAGTRFGLPEVNVGLIPGAGGTQRLPRLIGVEAALDMAAGGTMLSAERFETLGGLDRVFDGPVAEAAASFVHDLPPRPASVSRRPAPVPDDAMIADRRADLVKRARGQRSPLHNLDAVAWSALPFEEGQLRERDLHLALRDSAESRAMRHAFFAERAVARPDAIRPAAPRDIADIAIVGGGLMGAGIATAALGAGYAVTVIERDAEAADAARTRIAANIDGALSRGRIDADEAARQMAALATVDDYSASADCGLAIEAVFEDADVKRAVFRDLAARMAGDAILATNTSYLDPTLIFEGIARPDRCIGLHFFSPAHIMKLLEVVRLPDTSPETLATGFAMAKRLRKVAVMSGICDGFIGNRMLAAYRRAAEYMLADGALPQQVDTAMRGFGMAMGPFEAQDMSGLQIAEANRRRQDATRDPAERYVEIADRICARGRFGQRAGKGWYRYDGGSRAPQPDAEVTDLIEGYSRERGIERRVFSESDIQARLLAVLANEGARIVAEGIADGDGAIDVVQLNGYGFPRWRGGPMFAAGEAGAGAIRAALDALDAAGPGSWPRAERYA